MCLLNEEQLILNSAEKAEKEELIETEKVDLSNDVENTSSVSAAEEAS